MHLKRKSSRGKYISTDAIKEQMIRGMLLLAVVTMAIFGLASTAPCRKLVFKVTIQPIDDASPSAFTTDRQLVQRQRLKKLDEYSSTGSIASQRTYRGGPGIGVFNPSTGLVESMNFENQPAVANGQVYIDPQLQIPTQVVGT